MYLLIFHHRRLQMVSIKKLRKKKYNNNNYKANMYKIYTIIYKIIRNIQ